MRNRFGIHTHTHTSDQSRRYQLLYSYTRIHRKFAAKNNRAQLRPPALLRNPQTREVRLERVNLQRENSIVRNGIDGPPETSIEEGDYALKRVSSGGLDSSPRVAQDDVRSAEPVRMPEDSVRVIGDDVGADVVLTSARGPRNHGMDGLVAEAVSDDEGENCFCGAAARVIVEWRLIGNLRNGCDGITVRGPRDIGFVRCDTRGPLRVRFLVDSGPNLAMIQGVTVNGTSTEDGYLIGDFD